MQPRVRGLFARSIVIAAIGAGLLAVVLVALPAKVFELDRHFVPKELVLHGVALLSLGWLLSRTRRLAVDASDALLALFVASSGVSAILATNHWLAQRALGAAAVSLAQAYGVSTGYFSAQPSAPAARSATATSWRTSA